jgi:hypothetical protein
METCDFTTTQASTIAWFTTEGILGKTNLNIKDLNKFRVNNTKWSNYTNARYGTSGRLFSEKNNGKTAVPNISMFNQVDSLKNPIIQNRDIEFFNNDRALFEQEEKEVLNQKNTGIKENKFDIELANKIQNRLEKLYPEIELNITENPIWETNGNIFNQKEYTNQVNYRLKAVDLLISNKANEVFEKGKKNSWDLNKILTELQIPKNQKQIILSFENTNFSFGKLNLRESIITSLLADNSFVVEVNTATDNKTSVSFRNAEGMIVDNSTGNNIDVFIYNRDTYEFLDEDSGTFYLKNNESISEKEFNNALKNYGSVNTNYYSTLTVPGGTNYTENEVSTPGITPNIKGHAQFSTDNGIGWFRSDVKTQKFTGEINYEEELNRIDGWDFEAEVAEYFNLEEPFATREQKIQYLRKTLNTDNRVESSKTRRILEVQSDLFQKGRDKKDLTTYDSNLDADLYRENFDSIEEMKEYEKNSGKKDNKSNDNQFLQLLNKKGNWVNFFIQSIVQDSAKKGYEKVLFPSGNTASKIEGHTTLEGFKKEKEGRIKNLNNNLQDLEEYKNAKVVEDNSFAGYKFLIDKNSTDGVFSIKKSDDKKELEDIIKSRKSQIPFKIEEIIKEITQLKQELERVEKEGFGALKPIYNFYENTVTNTLNKLFDVNKITDEHGNTWNEINITPNLLSDILLQKNEASNIIGQANIKAMTVLVDAVNQKQDTLPHEYAHHYISWNRNTPIVQEAIKKWGTEEKLVQSIGEQVVKQKGEAYNWWKNFTKWLLNKFNSLSKLEKQELTQILTDSFLTRQNLNNTDNTQSNIDNTVNNPNIRKSQQNVVTSGNFEVEFELPTTNEMLKFNKKCF